MLHHLLLGCLLAQAGLAHASIHAACLAHATPARTPSGSVATTAPDPRHSATSPPREEPSARAPGSSGMDTGFEAAPEGPFSSVQTEIGRLTVIEGPARIERGHARSGAHCLQLPGPRTVLELELAHDAHRAGTLVLHAERWTARGPFRCVFESWDGAAWRPLRDATREIVVGRGYKSLVRLPLDGVRDGRLRCTVESPAETGILIDDMRLVPATPQRIASVEAGRDELPVLVGRDSSPLARVSLQVDGSLDPIAVTRVRVTLDGTTDRRDLRSLVVRIGPSWDDAAAVTVAEVPPSDGAIQEIPVTARAATLTDGAHQLWVGCRLAEDVDIDHRVGIDIESIEFSNDTRVKVDMPPASRRLGVALRRGGDGGVHTTRIPGLATTNAGTLIAVYDNRLRGGHDLPGDIDVGMSRSTDGGRSWEPMRTIIDMGDDPAWRHDGVGDPSILVDRVTGTIWVAALWSHGDRGWNGSGPGMSPEETGQLVLVRSDDDGVSWSAPINITGQVKDPSWSLMFNGPGKGVTLADGTLVFPAQFRSSPESGRVPHSTIIWSRDRGRTWRCGTGAFPHTTESQVIEIAPGELMLNCRYDRQAARVVMTTRDLGATWSEHPTSRVALVEPGACMASLVEVDGDLGRAPQGRVLFSNPDHAAARERLMIKSSPDGGLTWPDDRRVLLDSGRSAGYSCMSMIDAHTVGIVYECSQAHLAFQRVALSDLLPQRGAFRLNRGFGSHMVLQADRPIVLHGTGLPGARVACSVGADHLEAAVDDHGRWQVRFPARTASAEPIRISAACDGVRIECTDVLVGEVWICAGQSNMEWPVRRSTESAEVLGGPMPGGIRMLDSRPGAWTHAAPYGGAEIDRLEPSRFAEGTWSRAEPATVAEVSAVGWWFARSLHDALGVPIGIVDLAVGGSPTEAWIPANALAADPEARALLAGDWLANPRLTGFCARRGRENLAASIDGGTHIPRDGLGPHHPFKPGFLWSAALEPLLPFACRGVAWYQGESNAESSDRAAEQRTLLATLIDSWRAGLGDGALPFVFVQLPAMDRPHWPAFRESQRRVLADRAGLGMAVTIDLGLRGDVHPPDKRPVGERLAERALATAYGHSALPAACGPVVASTRAVDGGMRVTFDHAGRGLTTRDGAPVRHLEVAGADGVWHAATGRIESDRVLIVRAEAVPDPRAVRYAWLPFPDPPANLTDSDGRPASPFTSADDDR